MQKCNTITTGKEWGFKVVTAVLSKVPDSNKMLELQEVAVFNDG